MLVRGAEWFSVVRDGDVVLLVVMDSATEVDPQRDFHVPMTLAAATTLGARLCELAQGPPPPDPFVADGGGNVS
jgi:hypothetical protein